jgi:plasmid stabilization system protein ParE
MIAAMIVVRPEASLDATDAAHWYEDQLAGLGRRFLDALDQTIVLIADNPHQYPVYFQSVRRIHIQHFPYAIFFVSNEHRVIILAVLHLHRDPRLLRKTLRQRE